jgi:basic membrane lipoprotein Med (substrate-binding protein (PBP1-ABC) superfamily)
VIATDRYPMRAVTAALLLLALMAASCAREEPGPASSGAPNAAGGAASADAMKVGLLVTGPVTDEGWNQIAYDGLKRIEQDLGAQVSHQITEKAEQFEEGFRGYAQQGYRLVFGHGDEFSDAVDRVAPEYPETIFVTTGGRTVRPNAAPIRLRMEEATYLLGIIAAGVSRSGKAAQIGGMELPPVKTAFDAFAAGARSVNPSFQATTQYVGSWTNSNAAKEMALASIRAGADILFPNADAAGLGVFQAVKENQAKGVYAFGANKDQNSIAPEVILASAVLDVPEAFLQIAREVKDGSFQGEVHPYGMKSGVVSLVLNPALESKLPAATRQKIDETKQAIEAGTLKVDG